MEFDDAISGRHVSMKDLLGKVVVVEFGATRCGPCVREIPKMKRLQDRSHDQGAAFIGSTEARGRLETLIPRLLRESRVASSGR